MPLMAALASAALSTGGSLLASRGKTQKVKGSRLRGYENRLLRQGLYGTIDELQEARTGRLDLRGLSEVGQAREAGTESMRANRMAIASMLANPDTMVSGFHALAASKASRTPLQVGEDISSTQRELSNRRQSEAFSGIESYDAIRRGYQLEDIRNRGNAAYNRQLRRNIIGQGIGSALSTIGQGYMSQQMLNSETAQQTATPQQFGINNMQQMENAAAGSLYGGL